MPAKLPSISSYTFLSDTRVSVLPLSGFPSEGQK